MALSTQPFRNRNLKPSIVAVIRRTWHPAASKYESADDPAQFHTVPNVPKICTTVCTLAFFPSVSHVRNSGPSGYDDQPIVSSHHTTNGRMLGPLSAAATQPLAPAPPQHPLAYTHGRKPRRQAQYTPIVSFHLCDMSPHVAFHALKDAWSLVLTSGKSLGLFP